MCAVFICHTLGGFAKCAKSGGTPVTLQVPFAVFFKEKIEKIRRDLPVVSQLTVSLPPSPVKINLLEPATADELRDIIKRSKSTSCSLDPIPTWLFKGHSMPHFLF